MTREDVIEAIKSQLEKNIGIRIEVSSVTKNNGVTLTGVIVDREGNASTRPTLYIDSLVDKVLDEKISMDAALGEITRAIADLDGVSAPTFSREKLTDKEYILANVTPYLTNGGMNRQMKNEAPHRDYLDLAVFYRVFVGIGSGDEYMSYIVKNSLAESVGVTEQELFDAAMANALKEGYAVMTIDEIMAEIMGVDANNAPETGMPMYVLTTKERRWGASVLLHTEYFKGLSERCGNDLYVLPSSIHEVLAIPADYGEAEALREIVGCVNADEVSPDEVLGSAVYMYSRENNLLTIAE